MTLLSHFQDKVKKPRNTKFAHKIDPKNSQNVTQHFATLTLLQEVAGEKQEANKLTESSPQTKPRGIQCNSTCNMLHEMKFTVQPTKSKRLSCRCSLCIHLYVYFFQNNLKLLQWTHYH